MTKLIQEDEVTVTVTVVDVQEEPPVVLFVHHAISRGVSRIITQKVPVPDADLFARVAPYKQTGVPAKATIVTQWYEDDVQNYLRDFSPIDEPLAANRMDIYSTSNGVLRNGNASSGVSAANTTKQPVMVKE